MTDYHLNGWTFGAGLDYTLNDRFAIELISLGVDHFPLDKEWSATNAPPGGSITVVSMVSGLRGRLTRGHTGLFLAAGAGLFRAASWDVELTTGETIEGKDQTSLGWSLGGGIERRLSERATAFTEVRAIFATTAFDNSVYYPVRGGLRFDVW
jgi:opacity protein-like surface antigen